MVLPPLLRVILLLLAPRLPHLALTCTRLHHLAALILVIESSDDSPLRPCRVQQALHHGTRGKSSTTRSATIAAKPAAALTASKAHTHTGISSATATAASTLDAAFFAREKRELDLVMVLLGLGTLRQTQENPRTQSWLIQSVEYTRRHI